MIDRGQHSCERISLDVAWEKTPRGAELIRYCDDYVILRFHRGIDAQRLFEAAEAAARREAPEAGGPPAIATRK
jgi:hypothetical protein